MSLVERASKKIMRNAIISLAAESDTSCTNVQLLMQFKGVHPIVYGMNDYEIVKPYTYKELYPTVIDILNVREMIPMFIANLLVDESQKENETPDKIKIIVSTNKEDADIVYPYLYKETKLLRRLNWDEVFGNQALMKIMAKQQ